MEISREQNVASYALVPLVDAANRPDYKASPTLAAGDVKVIRHTGGSWNESNIGTLPAVIGGTNKQILVTLTATELNPDDNKYPIIVQFVDQTATKEWDDQTIIIWTRSLVSNVKEIEGSAQSATDLKDFADAGYDPATNYITGVAGTKNTLDDLNDVSTAQVNAECDTALSDYDGPTKAEMDSGFAALNDLSAAEVNAEVDTALNDYDGPTKAEMDSGFAALNDLSAADINAEVDTALSDIGLDHLVQVAVTGVDVTDNSIFAKLVSASATADWDDYVNTTDSMQATADAIGALNNISSGDVQSACDTAITANTDINNIDIGVDAIEAKLPSKDYLTGTTNSDGDIQLDEATGAFPAGAFTNHPAVDLNNDAITASKYDESTAFPITSADSGSTAVARTGSDTDTLETLSDQIDGVQTSIDGIQNNTKFVATAPVNMLIPDSGDTMYKITAHFYDSDGNMEDPDNNEIDILYEGVDGTDKDAFFDDAGGSTGATAGTIDVNTWQMVKISTGVYETYYKLPNTETPEQWTASFKLEESSALLNYARSTNVVEENPGSTTLADNTTNKDIIAEAMKERDVSGTGAVSGSVYKDINDNIDANGTAISALNDISAAEVNAEVDTALSDYDGPTKAEMDSGFAALNNLSTAEVNAEVDTALSDYDGPTKTEMDNAFAALNDISAAEVNAEVDTALSDYDGPTKAEIDSGFAALNNLSAAEVNTECDTALSDIGLNHLISASVVGADITDDSIIAQMVSKSATADWDSFDNTSDSLEAIADSESTPLTAQQVRDAMKLAPTGGAPAAGSVDEHLDDIQTVTDALPNNGALTDIDTGVDAIEAKLPSKDYLAGSANADGDVQLDDATGAFAAGAFANHPDVDLNADQSAVTVGTVNALGAQAKLDVNAECDTANSDYGALKPTIAGRGLDVNIGGEAGIDLDNTSGTLAKGTEITGFNDVSTAQVQSSCDAAIAANTDINNIDIGVDNIEAKLPSKDYLAGTANTDGDVQLDEATGAFVVGAFTNHPTVGLNDDAITASKFDETTAYPITAADTGSTAVARTGADGDTLETLSDQIDGVQTSVDGIQNNTKFVATVPTYLIIPATGTTMYKITAHFYDSDGNMEDPDNNEIDILYEDVSGGDKDAFFDDASGTTPATAGVIDTNMWKMVKISTGVYETYYKLPNTETEDQWTASFKLEEASTLLNYSRSSNLLAETPGTTTLADNTTNKDIIAEALKERDVSATGAVSGSVYKDINDNIDANETKIDTIDTEVGLIKTVTDQLPNSGALTDIDTGVNNIEAKLPSKSYLAGTANTDGDIQLDEATGAFAIGAYVNHPDVDLNSDQNGVTIGTVNTLGIQAKLDVNAEVDIALSDIGLDHLLSVAVTGTDVTDNSVFAKIVSKSATADWDTFDNTEDSLEALSDEYTGTVDANIVSINGDLTSGNNAILNLKQLNIQSDVNLPAVYIRGNGSGHGIDIGAGATGNGVEILGGATSGNGLGISTTNGTGIEVTTAAGVGVKIDANSTAIDINSATAFGIDLDSAGPGIDINSINAYGVAITAGSGNGLRVRGSNAVVFEGTGGNAVGLQILGDSNYGMQVSGDDGAAGLYIKGGATGNGVEILGGATSGNGMQISAQGGGDVGLKLEGALNGGSGLWARARGGNGSGIIATGNGAGNGISALSASTGHGIHAEAGSTSGNGINTISPTSGHGIHAQGGVGGGGGGTGYGIFAEARDDGYAGFYALGEGGGAGIKSEGGATGNAVEIVGGSTSGKGINVSTTDGTGLDITTANGIGIQINADDTAIDINSATAFGIDLDSAGPGIDINSVNAYGVSITAGSGNGLRVRGSNAVVFEGTGGNAVGLQCLGDSNYGMQISGDDGAAGLYVKGGATGHGMEITGGSTSGDGINISTTDGHGMNIDASTGAGNIGIYSVGKSVGLHAKGEYVGIYAESDVAGTSGPGFKAVGNGGPGIEARGYGAQGYGIGAWGDSYNSGFYTEGGATGHGIETCGGYTSGHGIYSYGITNGVGIYAEGLGSGNHGIYAVGNEAGSGAKLEGGAIGNGLEVVGGSYSGIGIKVTTTDGHGINIIPGGVLRSGLKIAGGSVSGNGIEVSTTDGIGIDVAGGTNGHGILATGAGSGHGMSLVKGSTGKDIDADEIDAIVPAIETECDDALNAYDSGNGVARQSSVDSIQNNTRFVAAIPSYCLIPVSGSTVYKLKASFYDSVGNMEDPDLNEKETGTNTSTEANKLHDTLATFQTNLVQIGDVVYNDTDSTEANVTAVNGEIELTLDADIFTGTGKMYRVGMPEFSIDVETAEGTDKNGLLYKEFALTNALDNSVKFSGHKELEREAKGVFFCYIEIANTEAEAQFMYDFACEEGGSALHYSRTTLVLEEAPEGVIDANVISIDDELTSGNNATLNLKQLNIQSDANLPGIYVRGSGAGNGIYVEAGATGRGIYVAGGSTSGDGLHIESGIAVIGRNGGGVTAGTNGEALRLTGYEKPAVLISTLGTPQLPDEGATVRILGGSGPTGSHAVSLFGGTSSSGLHIRSGNPGQPVPGVPYSPSLLIDHPAGMGGDKDGIRIVGIDAGRGVAIQGGETGKGVEIKGGSTSGNGIDISTTDGHGIDITPGANLNRGINITAMGGSAAGGIKITTIGNAIDTTAIGYGMAIGGGIYVAGAPDKSAIELIGNGIGHGLEIEGGATGNGIKVAGGAVSGNGIDISTTDGHGISIIPAGSYNAGMAIQGGPSGIGLRVWSGSGSGGDAAVFTPYPGSTDAGGITIMGGGTSNAIDVACPGGTGHGMTISSGVDKAAVKLVGSGSKEGLWILGGPTGNGVTIEGGSTSGDGVHIETGLAGDGMHINGGDNTGHGLYIETGLSGYGALVSGGTTGAGLRVEANNGHGVEVFSTNGHGLSVSSLNLKGIDVISGYDYPAISLKSNGTGDGLKIVSGTNGNGVSIVGGATSGDGINVKAQGGDGNGFIIRGNGTGKDIDAKEISNIITDMLGVTIDGTATFEIAMKQILAYCGNNVDRAGAVYTYKNYDDTADAFVLSGSAVGRTRT